MKINSMTTISKSITLKILRATNQVCQLKSNARRIYRQIAAQSVTQHAWGLMGLPMYFVSSPTSHSSVEICGLLLANQSKRRYPASTHMVWWETLGSQHMWVCRTCCHHPASLCFCHPCSPQFQPTLAACSSTTADGWAALAFQMGLLLYLKNPKAFFLGCTSIVNSAPLLLHPFNSPPILLHKSLCRTESHLDP